MVKRDDPARERHGRRGFQTGGAHHRGRIRISDAIARQHRPGLRGRRCEGRRGHGLDLDAEAAITRAECIADLLGLPREKVRAIWMFGTGSYGRNDQGDATADAAVLSQHLGRPVRVQYMRHEGLAWDPKGTASVNRSRAGLDASGKVIAYENISKAFSRTDIAPQRRQGRRCAGRPSARARR